MRGLEIMALNSEFFYWKPICWFSSFNIPLEKAIDIWANIVLENTERVCLSEADFKELLSLSSKES